MAATGTITISGSIQGLPSGTKAVSLSIAVTDGIDATTLVDLASGFNSISVPTGADMAILVPPTTNTQTLTLKGVTGDTGVAISKTKPTLIAFDATPPATIGITAGAAVAGFVVVFI